MFLGGGGGGMGMRARSFDRRPSHWFICGLLARKMWMKEGGGGENGSALLFGASLALRLWLARRRENIRGGGSPTLLLVVFYNV